jgi:ribosomal protein L21E
MSEDEVFAAIEDGELDDWLDQIIGAAQERRQLVRTRAARKLKTGDKIEFVSIKPKYMEGLTGKIVGKRGTKFRVVLDEDSKVGRFANAPEVICPGSILRKIG